MTNQRRRTHTTVFQSAICNLQSAILVLLFLFVLLLPHVGSAQQSRTGEARRRSEVAAIELPGGSRVEFKSFHSASLDKDQPYSIFLPPSYNTSKSKKYPVVYFLHGLNNDYTSWTVDRYGKLQDKVEAMIKKGTIPEIIMVHPNGDNSFYTNCVDGSRRYEDFIVNDLIQHIESTYRVQTGRN